MAGKNPAATVYQCDPVEKNQQKQEGYFVGKGRPTDKQVEKGDKAKQGAKEEADHDEASEKSEKAKEEKSEKAKEVKSQKAKEEKSEKAKEEKSDKPKTDSAAKPAKNTPDYMTLNVQNQKGMASSQAPAYVSLKDVQLVASAKGAQSAAVMPGGQSAASSATVGTETVIGGPTSTATTSGIKPDASQNKTFRPQGTIVASEKSDAASSTLVAGAAGSTAPTSGPSAGVAAAMTGVQSLPAAPPAGSNTAASKGGAASAVSVFAGGNTGARPGTAPSVYVAAAKTDGGQPAPAATSGKLAASVFVTPDLTKSSVQISGKTTAK